MHASHILYRLPNERIVHELRSSSKPKELPAIEDINAKRGYVFAPFTISSQRPLLLIEPEVETSWILPKRFAARHFDYTDTEAQNHAQYATEFAQSKQLLEEKQVEKIVLSRRLTLQLDSKVDSDDLHNLFLAACNNYPACYVALVQTPQAGTWLMATPEVLLEERDGCLHTMALAATMSLDEGGNLPAEEWSEQHRQEQQMVADYIEQRLVALQLPHTKSALHIKRSAQLAHLCTRFTIPIPETYAIGQVLSALHPTPAVCGIPTTFAHQNILHIESHDRSYYTGFSGPIGLASGTHTYVTLRCMQIDGQHAHLYAGGGLLPQSDEKREWIETCRKLKAMIALFQ